MQMYSCRQGVNQHSSITVEKEPSDTNRIVCTSNNTQTGQSGKRQMQYVSCHMLQKSATQLHYISLLTITMSDYNYLPLFGAIHG